MDAVVWELRCSSGGVGVFRGVVVGDCLVTQVVPAGSGSGLWEVEGFPGVAGERGVAVTRFVEERYGGVLSAGPVVVPVGAAEYEALMSVGAVPAVLRARLLRVLRRVAV